MPTVVETPGAANANSYETRAGADAYHTTRPAAQVVKWTTATNDDKDAALIMATELFDAALNWNGAPASDTQALAHPRTGLVNRVGAVIPSNVIAPELKRATAEFARRLLTSDRTGDNDVARMGITDLAAGPVKLSFSEDKTSQYVGSTQVGVPKVIPDIVLLMLPSSWYTVPTNENAALFDIESL